METWQLSAESQRVLSPGFGIVLTLSPPLWGWVGSFRYINRCFTLVLYSVFSSDVAILASDATLLRSQVYEVLCNFENDLKQADKWQEPVSR